MALINWLGQESALSQFERAQHDFDRLLTFFRPWSTSSLWNTVGAGVYPPINVYDDSESYIVRAELPGVDPKDIDISVANNTLTIKGKRETDVEGKNVSYHRRERNYGEFRRAFTLPDAIDSGKVMAHAENGILEVRLPRAEQAKPRRVEVKVNG
jgi:HSP20 family protein